MTRIFNPADDMKEFVNELVASATAPSFNVPRVPRANRFRMKSSIIVMDDVPNNYIVNKIGTLDFWNEIEGFFLKNSTIPTYDLRTTDWELPSISFADKSKVTIGDYFAMCVGDRIVDKEYNIYKVVGFHNNSGSDIYFNIK